MSEPMTKSERDDLAKLVRRREKLAKADADRVASERMAAFEAQVATDYRINDSAVWEEAYRTAVEAAEQANERVLEEYRRLGLDERFAPRIANPMWLDRGEHAAKSRVTELRRVAKARIDADAKTLGPQIERRSVEVQSELIAGGLRSEEARRFLEAMPTAEALMPTVSVLEIEEAVTPLQLVRGRR